MMIDPLDTDPAAESSIPSKMVTLGLYESHDGMAGVAFTITTLERGAISIGFTEAEADDAWRAMQRWYFKVEAENDKRRKSVEEI